MLGNYAKTALLLGLLAGLVIWVGQLLGGMRGMTFAFIFVLLFNGGAFFFSHKLVLRMYHARPAKRKEYPVLHAIVADVAKKARLPKPKIFIIPTEHANAFATGRSPRHAAVACTQGILKLLSEKELKGVIAHELAHIKNRDMLITTIAAVMAGLISYVAMMARWAALFGGYGARDNRDGGDIFSLLALTILTPLIALLLQLAISRSREYIADASGAAFLREGKGLASALKKLSHGPKLRAESTSAQATASLFIVHPFTSQGFLHLFMTHPSLENRIKRLGAMQF